MSIKYIKELGTGFSGTVYLVKIKNYKKIDICELIDNIKKNWFSSDKKKLLM